MMDEVRLMLVTAPDRQTGLKIARALVEDRLAACVNIIPGLTSVYRWQGGLEEDEEVQLLIKTRSRLVDRVTEKVNGLHPYDLPEVISLAVEGGSAAYLNWVWNETQPV